MEKNERCSNCAFYPFCKKCAGPLALCENWRKVSRKDVKIVIKDCKVEWK